MALHGRILSLRQDGTHLHYKATWPSSDTSSSAPLTPPSSFRQEVSKGLDGDDDTEGLVRHYFSLKYDAAALYEQWSKTDSNFRAKAAKFSGIRMLRQDGWETLIGFICSSNNNISRISQMMHKLCRFYGPLIGSIGEAAYYDFPTPESLAGERVESQLRELGFGYRAKYIAQSARIVWREKAENWLESLSNPENAGWGPGKTAAGAVTYKEAHAQLLGLAGVGPKVADCVCLMGLGWGQAVPVDTHVWQIAQRDYKIGKAKTKSLSKAMYDAVGDHFRDIWGSQAGWAQSVLFTANLKSFSDRIKSEPGQSAEVEEAEVKVEDDLVVSGSTPRSKARATPRSVKRHIDAVETGGVEDGTGCRVNKRRSKMKGMSTKSEA